MSADTQERPEEGTWHEHPELGVTVVTYRSLEDGAVVVEVETTPTTGQVRVYINDGVVFDKDPEEAT